MTWGQYGTFVAFAVVLVLVPGPDFAVTLKNTLLGGRRRGGWTALGIGMSNAVQGTAAVTGLSALIIRAQPLFEAIRWAGVCYLLYLGLHSFRSAIRGRYPALVGDAAPSRAGAAQGWRQGFLSNLTNPKVLVFYLAVLPQFLRPGTAPGWLLAFAWSHAILSCLYLSGLAAGLGRLRPVLTRRGVRRGLDAATGAALAGFSAKLAADAA